MICNGFGIEYERNYMLIGLMCNLYFLVINIVYFIVYIIY